MCIGVWFRLSKAVGHLEGIEQIIPPKPLEIMPYIVGRSTLFLVWSQANSAFSADPSFLPPAEEYR